MQLLKTTHLAFSILEGKDRNDRLCSPNFEKIYTSRELSLETTEPKEKRSECFSFILNPQSSTKRPKPFYLLSELLEERLKLISADSSLET